MSRSTVQAAIRATIADEMRRDDRVIVIGGDVRSSVSGYAAGLLDEFGPRRVIDFPFGEASIAGAANGAAMGGLRPIVDLGNIGFSLTAMDQIANEGPKTHFVSNGQLRAPIVYLFDHSSQGWGPQHDQAIYAVLAHLPGMKLVNPASPRDARQLVAAAIRDDNPVAVLIPHSLKNAEGELLADDLIAPLGRARVVRRGDDVTIVAIGDMVELALEAAEIVALRGHSVEVIDPRTLVPLDWASLALSVRRTRRAVVCDRGHYTCGLAVTIAAGLHARCFDDLVAPVLPIASLDVPVGYATQLAAATVPSLDRLLDAIDHVLARSPHDAGGGSGGGVT